MKIVELFEDDISQNASGTFTSDRTPKNSKQKMTRIPIGYMDPSYTPGKASLDQEYLKVQKFTKTKIPHIQKELNDPRS